MHIFLMKGIDYLLNIFRILRCKLQSIPAKISPILPVLNNGVDGMSAPPVLGSYVQNLPSGPIAFLALPVAVSPFGEEGRVSGQAAEVERAPILWKPAAANLVTEASAPPVTQASR